MAKSKKQSAGILLYRILDKRPEFFLVHPGGPYWKNKEEGSWTIPKGEFMADEEALQGAIPEFREETGRTLNGPFLPLTPVQQKSGKQVSFPEVDKRSWFDLATAARLINPAQTALLEELTRLELL